MQDDLIADAKVARMCGVCLTTIKRWSKNPSVNFPPGIRIGNRTYRSAAALSAWREERERAVAKAIAALSIAPVHEVAK